MPHEINVGTSLLAFVLYVAVLMVALFLGQTASRALEKKREAQKDNYQQYLTVSKKATSFRAKRALSPEEKELLRKPPKRPWRFRIPEGFIGFLAGTVVLALGGAAVFFTVGALTSSSGPEGRQATVKEVAEHFGLTPGKSYPFELGSRNQSVVGEGSAEGSFVGFEGSIKIQPESVVSIGFQSDAKSYILELPTQSVIFKVSNSAIPSLKLYLKNANRGDDADLVAQNLSCESDVFTDPPLLPRSPFSSCWNQNVRYTYGVCQWGFHNLVWQCVGPLLRTDYVFSNELDRRGLATVVKRHFDSAEITLTKEMYQKLLGSS